MTHSVCFFHGRGNNYNRAEHNYRKAINKLADQMNDEGKSKDHYIAQQDLCGVYVIISSSQEQNT